MIIGTGVDIIELDRVGRLVTQDPFPDKIFAQEEIRSCREEGFEGPRLIARYAGLFAAKEAVMKALGTGWTGGVAWIEIVISHGEKGQPLATLKGKTRSVAEAMGVKKVHVSISHSQKYAVATATLEGTTE